MSVEWGQVLEVKFREELDHCTWTFGRCTEHAIRHTARPPIHGGKNHSLGANDLGCYPSRMRWSWGTNKINNSPHTMVQKKIKETTTTHQCLLGRNCGSMTSTLIQNPIPRIIQWANWSRGSYHLLRINNILDGLGWHVKCRFFLTTFKESTLRWFSRLPLGIITLFAKFKWMFATQFASAQKPFKSSQALL